MGLMGRTGLTGCMALTDRQALTGCVGPTVCRALTDRQALTGHRGVTGCSGLMGRKGLAGRVYAALEGPGGLGVPIMCGGRAG